MHAQPAAAPEGELARRGRIGHVVDQEAARPSRRARAVALAVHEHEPVGGAHLVRVGAGRNFECRYRAWRGGVAHVDQAWCREGPGCARCRRGGRPPPPGRRRDSRSRRPVAAPWRSRRSPPRAPLYMQACGLTPTGGNVEVGAVVTPGGPHGRNRRRRADRTCPAHHREAGGVAAGAARPALRRLSRAAPTSGRRAPRASRHVRQRPPAELRLRQSPRLLRGPGRELRGPQPGRRGAHAPDPAHAARPPRVGDGAPRGGARRRHRLRLFPRHRELG